MACEILKTFFLCNQGGKNELADEIAALKVEGQDSKDAADGFRTVTGVLTSRPASRDIKISGFSMSITGGELIQDCSIELTIGRRYGLIGQNGSGKTNFLKCLAKREVPIPSHMDLYHLDCEAEPSDRTALEAVIDHLKNEMEKLEALEQKIMEEVSGSSRQILLLVSARPS